MVQRALLASLLLVGGCSTLTTIEGARTLEPGQAQIGGALSMQRGGNALSYTGIPIPQLEIAGRLGVAPDVDMGLRLYLLGIGYDVRYRFYHRGRFHAAITPGLYAVWIPTGATGQGSAEARAPLTVEYELSDLFSVAGGPRLIFRNQWNSVNDPELGSGAEARLDVFSGGGLRLDLHPGQWGFGLSGDLYSQPARKGGLAWSIGLDVTVRTRRQR